jgi:hypothetical protein
MNSITDYVGPHKTPITIAQNTEHLLGYERPRRIYSIRGQFIILSSLFPQNFWIAQMPSIHFPNTYIRSCLFYVSLPLYINDADIALLPSKPKINKKLKKLEK